MVSVIGSTYARYTSSSNGEGTVSIAKWAVRVNTKDVSSTTATFDLEFTANNSNTIPNRVAPGGTATAYVDVDLTDTEVSVGFNCALSSNATALQTVFGNNYIDKVTVEVGEPTLVGDESERESMTLDADKKVVTVGDTPMKGTVRVPIALTWKDADGNNTEDTSTGALQTGVTIPVTLTVQQYIPPAS